MIAYLLAERKDASFRVYTVQASMPPKSFTEKTRSKIFPVVIGLSGQDNNKMNISDLVCDSYDEVEKFFESINMTCPKLKRQHRDNLLALKVFEDLYKVKNYSLVIAWFALVSIVHKFSLNLEFQIQIDMSSLLQSKLYILSLDKSLESYCCLPYVNHMYSINGGPSGVRRCTT